jgi:sugar phosphate isomerase/epimerase
MKKKMDILDRIVSSPACNPEMVRDDVLRAYSGIGYTQFEVFTAWAKSAFDYHKEAAHYREIGARYGMAFPSLHLPPVGEDGDISEAVTAARFAEELGAEIVLFKATSRPAYIRSAGTFLDAVDDLNVTPVLQNHAGSPIESLADFREVIEGIGDDRMKTLLEVGHFHAVGVSWREGYDLLTESVALVHIKDMLGRQSVPFGTGEIDLPELFKALDAAGYAGRYVVEMEVEDRENTLTYLAEALIYMKKHLKG